MTIFRKSVDKTNILLKSDKNNNKFKFVIISRRILRTRNVSERSCRKTQNTHFKFNFFFSKSSIYEIMWKNMVEPERLQMTI